MTNAEAMAYRNGILDAAAIVKQRDPYDIQLYNSLCKMAFAIDCDPEGNMMREQEPKEEYRP